MLINRKFLLTGIALLTILVTACGQSEQATSIAKPPTLQQVGEIREVNRQTAQPKHYRLRKKPGRPINGIAPNAMV